jgi:excisionase family DNA binding protein
MSKASDMIEVAINSPLYGARALADAMRGLQIRSPGATSDPFCFKVGGQPTHGAIVTAATSAPIPACRRRTRKPATDGSLSPPAVARLLGVKNTTVLKWVAVGQLKAVNLGNGKKRPRWSITRVDLEAFKASRQNGTPVTQVPAKRRKPTTERVTEYF